MTQKRKRDRSNKKPAQVKKKVGGWEMLEGVKQSLLTALETPVLLEPVIKDKRITSKLSEQETKLMCQDLKILGNDVRRLRDKINEISKEHEGKKGNPKDGDEIMEVILIDQKYKEVFSEVDTLITPPLLSISAKLDKKRLEVIEDQNKILEKVGKELEEERKNG